MAVKAYDKKAYQEKREKEMQGMRKTITNIMKTYQDSPENLAELAQFSARFYAYSIRNQMLIQKQNAGAVFVGSFEKFKQLGYSVKRGEHGIKVFVPAPVTLFRKLGEEEWTPISEASKQEKQEIQKGLYDIKKLCVSKSAQFLIFHKRIARLRIIRNSCTWDTPANSTERSIGH